MQDEVNREESAQDEVDRMKQEADFTATVSEREEEKDTTLKYQHVFYLSHVFFTHTVCGRPYTIAVRTEHS